MRSKYLILGAGPAGLSIANFFKNNGENNFIVLEKEAEAGGLCRSCKIDGAPFDFGGGHFLDVRRPKINEFLFEFMPEEEWDIYERDSRISFKGNMVSHPLEANIWQLPVSEQVEYLKSIAIAGCNLGEEMPEEFTKWIYWKLGSKIADDYMIPYNKKIFSKSLDELGTYWLEKLPSVSFEETLLSCLEHKAYGTQPGHAKFYYPKKYGFGELWLRMAKRLDDKIHYNCNVVKVDPEHRMVESASGEIYEADVIITTIPWKCFVDNSTLPEKIKTDINSLKHTGVETRYFNENLETDAQWIYYPEQELPYHRILVRHNFCPNSRGYWTETNLERVEMFEETNDSTIRFYNEYAYPLNTKEKPQIMNEILTWSYERNIFPLGRWGEHQHYNSDLTVEKALNLGEYLLTIS